MMRNRYIRLLLVVLVGLSVGSCQPTSKPTATPTASQTIRVEVASSSPTVVKHMPTTQASSTEPSVPTATPLLPPGWSVYPQVKEVRVLSLDMDGNLLAGSKDGLLRIHPDGSSESVPAPEEMLANEITSISVTPEEVIWVGTWGGGVWRYEDNSWENLTTADGLWDDHVHAIAFFPEGVYEHLTLFFGTREGLSIYSAGNWSNYINAKYGLPNDEVLSIYTGPNGELWVGTRQGAWTNAFAGEADATDNALAGKQVNAIMRAPDCSLWFATEGGVHRFDGEQWMSYVSADGLAAENVLAIAPTLDGSLWTGTPAGVSRFDGMIWTTTNIPALLAGEQVNAILATPDGTIWFAASSALMRFTLLPEDVQGITSDTSYPQVVYLRDGYIWMWSHGSREKLFNEGNVESLKLSEDGNQIAFTRGHDGLVNQLWAAQSDGNDERLLVSAEDLAALLINPSLELPVVIDQYQWVPGLNSIAFSTRRQPSGPGTMLSDDLRLVDVQTGELTTLLPEGQAGRTIYSPDGSKLAIVTPHDISIMNAEGSYLLEKVLEYPSVITYSEYQYYPHPVWSLDSQYLRLALPPEDAFASPSPPTTLWHIPAPDLPSDDDQATLLASVPAVYFLRSPVAFSPDLTRIAYTQSAGDMPGDQDALHLANADGSEDVVIHMGVRMEFLGWSPDGQHLAFRYGDTKQGVIAGLDGSRYPLDSNPLGLTWVDGEWFLHGIDLGCAYELRLTNLNGESQVIDRMWNFPESFEAVK